MAKPLACFTDLVSNALWHNLSSLPAGMFLSATGRPMPQIRDTQPWGVPRSCTKRAQI